MVESGKPKSTSSAHKINVSASTSTTKNASKNITFDEVLDDLRNLDDIENSSKASKNRQNGPSDSDAPVALTVAPPIHARPGQAVPVEDAEDSVRVSNANGQASRAATNTAKSKPSARPRPVRTTDGMIGGGAARRSNLAPIDKRPLGMPIEQRRRVAQQTVSAPKFKVADNEEEDEATFNPLLTAFWTKKRLIIGGVVLVALLLIGGIAFAMVNKSKDDSDTMIADEDSDVEEDVDSSVIDYNQAITDAEGNTLSAKHQIGNEEDLVVLFSDLNCLDATCSNVSAVKIGSTSLSKGTDYEISSKEGKLLLTIKANKLNSLKTGAYALIFEIVNGDKTARIGLRFKIEAGDQDTESETSTGSSSTGSSNSSNGGSSNTSKPSGSSGSSSSTNKPSASGGGTSGTPTPSTGGSSTGNGNTGNTGTSGGSTTGSGDENEDDGTSGGNTGTNPPATGGDNGEGGGTETGGDTGETEE